MLGCIERTVVRGNIGTQGIELPLDEGVYVIGIDVVVICDHDAYDTGHTG